MTNDTSKKLCADCQHVIAMACGKFRNDEGKPRFIAPLRAEHGPCGPEARGFERRGATTAVVLEFPKTHRASA